MHINLQITRTIIIFLLICLLLSGCKENTPPTKTVWKPGEFLITDLEKNQHLYQDKGYGSIVQIAFFNNATDCFRVRDKMQADSSQAVMWFCDGKIQ